MYWRVRKLSLKEMLLQNWTKLVLIFSVLLNLLFIATRPSPNKGVSAELKANYTQFAKQVTQHLLDTSYITYKSSTASLLNGELDKSVIEGMKKGDLLAKSDDDLEATYKGLYDNRQVSAVRVDHVEVGTPPPGKPIPVEVDGVVAIHSAQDSVPTNPVPFHFHLDMALRTGDDKQPVLGPDKQPLPVVVGFREIGGSSGPE